MSRASFSKSLSEDILGRFKAIDNLHYEKVFEMNDTFLFALCIAYMTLSKEKIILKDKSNMDRLGRLTRRVPTIDIDTLFVGDNQPMIHSSLESDSTWLLDNIRDSILHESSDILEDENKVVIQNNMYGRNLDAEVPFHWFYDYVDQDILNKRFTNHYTCHGFYYNNFDKDTTLHPDAKRMKNFNYQKNRSYYSVFHHVLYKVEIKGGIVPIHNLDKKIHDLFDTYAKEEVSEEDIEKYSPMITKKDGLLPVNYMVSFYKARDKVLKDLKAMFPHYDISIHIDYQKKKLCKKVQKSFINHYQEYDDLFKNLNELFERRSQTDLKSISRIYDYVKNHSTDELPYNYRERQDALMKIINGENYSISEDDQAHFHDFEVSQDTLRQTLLLVYGLTLLTLNKSSFQENDILEKLSLIANGSSRDAYHEYALKRRNLVSRILKLKVDYSALRNQWTKCPDSIKPKLEPRLDSLQDEIFQCEDELKYLLFYTKPYYETKEQKQKGEVIRNGMIGLIRNQVFNLDKKLTGNMKEDVKTKNIALAFYDRLAEIEDGYFMVETEPLETLEIMRNCFSHLGRVRLNHTLRVQDRDLILKDFDDKGHSSGIVRINYLDFIHFLNSCFQDEKKDGKAK